jgi:membrane-associated phospholipid phosphatase
MSIDDKDETVATAAPGRADALSDPRELWFEPQTPHLGSRVPCWIKVILLALLTLLCIAFVDRLVAAWVLRTHPIPDLANAQASGGDPGRELMLLEQWGQWVCSVVVIAVVAILDKAGRRRALAIAIGCLCTVLVSYLLKDLIGRSRPYVAEGSGWPPGSWVWGGPAMGFHKGSAWQSFPSSHTTGAFALSLGLAWFYPRGRGLFLGLALITAAQRVLHGAHFVSDTLAGMGIALLMTRWSLRAKLAGRLIVLAPPWAQAWWMGA